MVDVRDVAKWFLSKESMTHKKLQKLCYYAQAWHCALYGEPLFSDEIQAWVHGPVAPTLFHIYKNYGWRKIPQQNFDASSFSEDAERNLDTVWNTYGDFSDYELECQTHSEGPWQEARGALDPVEICTNPISPESMEKYYLDLYQRYQND